MPKKNTAAQPKSVPNRTLLAVKRLSTSYFTLKSNLPHLSGSFSSLNSSALFSQLSALFLRSTRFFKLLFPTQTFFITREHKTPTVSLRYFIIFLLLFLGAYLRLEPVFFNLTHFSFDQGIDIALVKKLVIDHKFSLIARYTGLEGVFMGPWYTWFMSLPFLLSSGHPAADIVYMTFWSVITSFAALYLFTRYLDSHSGFYTAFITIFAPSFIFASQIVYSPGPLTFLMLVQIVLLIEIILKANYQLVPALALICGFMFQFEVGFAVFSVPATLITLLIFSRFRWLSFSRIAWSFPAFIFPFLPQIIFDLRHNFIISSAISSFLSGKNTSLGQETGSFLNRINIRFGTFIEDFHRTSLMDLTPHFLAIIFGLLLAFGWWIHFSRRQQPHLKIGAITLSLIVFQYLGFIFFSGPVWHWYRVGMPLLFALISGIGLAGLSTYPRLLFTVIFLLTLISFKPIHRLTLLNHPQAQGVSIIANQQQILDTIYQDAGLQPFALYVYTPPVYPYIWDYQLYWYAHAKFGYLPKPYDVMPQTDNPNLIYLLIEPDEFPTRIDGWKGNFKIYGHPINSWFFDNSGVTVEKWIFTSQPDTATPLIRFVNVLDTN